jgi:hypothetical protein
VILDDQIIREPTNTQIIAEGVYNTDEDVNRINLAEGGDIGSYVIKITPDINFDAVTLRFEVKMYYCATRETPRRRFLEEFPRDAYLQYSHRLVTSNKTLEKLNEEEDYLWW